jgi:uncharacterized protein involved in exopolysaccharide biosynthesis
MAIPRKTMRDIRTISGRVDRIANPYMAYMQITCLEMEKARKGRERASALQRMELINARLRDIEAEKATLLRALTERGAAPAATQPSPGNWPAPSRRTGGFKLRY